MSMREDAGQRATLWAASADLPVHEPLEHDARTDVCIIGAGITGLTTAYLLAGAGRHVLVLESAGIGAGATGRTTAHISNALDDGYVALEELHGPDGARLAAASHTAAIDTIEAIVHDEAIDCDFSRVDGFLFLAPGDIRSTLERELAAASRAGITGVRFVERAPLPGIDTGPCLRFPRQAQFHPLRYLAGLARAATARGARIHERSHVTAIAGREPFRISTRGGPIVRASTLVAATGSPIGDPLVTPPKQEPFRTCVVALRIPHGAVEPALFWDTAAPYHYARTHPLDDAADALLVGGEDHRMGQAEDGAERFDRLIEWARAHFPAAGDVLFRWSGQVLEPVDRLALLGRNPAGPGGSFIATGDSGHGITHGTVAGILITDLILGRGNPWAKLYRPGRAVRAPALEDPGPAGGPAVARDTARP